MLAVFLLGAHAQHMGCGISKHTYTATDPHSCYSWFTTFLPAGCFDDMCDETVDCGNIGRCQLKSGFLGRQGGFGIHSVNASTRPYGTTPVSDVEDQFNLKIAGATAYDAFMDFNTVLYATSLDSYISAFKEKSQSFIVLKWADDKESVWYSVMVYVPNSQIVFELVSDAKPTDSSLDILEDPMVRLSHEVFTKNSYTSTRSSQLLPLAVSKSVSDMDAMDHFYADLLEQTLSFSQTMNNVTIHQYKLTGAPMQVRFFQRPVTNTTGDLTVAALEKIKNTAHEMSIKNTTWGFDKYMDNHWAWDQNNVPCDTFYENFNKEGGILFHIWGAPLDNIYVADPSGDSIQLDAGWNNFPGKSCHDDALRDLCTQGCSS